MTVLDWFLVYPYDNLTLFICLHLDNKIRYLSDEETVSDDSPAWVNKHRPVRRFWKRLKSKKEMLINMATSVVCFGILLMMLFLKNSVDSMTSFDCTLKAWVLKELHVLNDSNRFSRKEYIGLEDIWFSITIFRFTGGKYIFKEINRPILKWIQWLFSFKNNDWIN